MAHPELSKDIVRTKIDNETIVFPVNKKIKPNDVFLIGVYFNKGIVDASFEEIKEKDSKGQNTSSFLKVKFGSNLQKLQCKRANRAQACDKIKGV